VQLVFFKILSANKSFCTFVCCGQGLLKLWGFYKELTVVVNVVVTLAFKTLIVDKPKRDRM